MGYRMEGSAVCWVHATDRERKVCGRLTMRQVRNQARKRRLESIAQDERKARRINLVRQAHEFELQACMLHTIAKEIHRQLTE